MKQCMVTTMDNVYNPFTHFDEWYAYDQANGYNTCSMLAYFAKTSNELDEEWQAEDIERGIDRLLELNPLGIHMKVYEDDADLIIPIANKVFQETNKGVL